MQSGGIIDRTPIWALYILTVAVVLLSVEVGYRVGNRRRQRIARENEAPIGTLVGATLGLLAFLLAFTFGMAANRYDTRKQLVVQESNAIGTTFLRAGLLPEPQRTDARSALVEYTALRAKGVTSLLTPEAQAQSAALQDRLWAAAELEGTQNPNSIASGLYIQTVNEMIDVDAARIAAGRNRIPDIIWFVLYCVTILAMTATGYQFGLSGTRSWAETVLLVLSFAAIFLLIADLDRPQGGVIQVSQQAMIDLLNKIGTPTP